jgi:pyrroloquinoline-quinone synthase|tara:strand:- start:177 stop:836 length:660 start_codon:yes stop_codon:yes gene_type:complete
MNLSELNNRLDKLHLLNHPFYVAWEQGELTQEILQDYAEQYYQHIKAFPRYISATHSMCEDIEKRKLLLDNLSDEENLNKDHPMLWKQFALAAGADESSLDLVKQEYFTSDLIENFFRLSRSSYAEGLGALYAYERQVPEIAETKIKGLIDHYNISTDQGLEYFVVHKDADVLHREQSEKLMLQLNEEEQVLAEEAALSTGHMLWSFLSGLCDKHDIKN